MSLDYKTWIRAAKERLVALENQRQAIDIEMAALEKSIQAFEPLANILPSQRAWGTGIVNNGWLPIPDGGKLTNAVRSVFRDNPRRDFEPTEVRDTVVHNGFDLSGRSNAMANIHQVIKRLTAQEEVREVKDGPAGRIRYQWIEKSPLSEPLMPPNQNPAAS